MSASTATPPRRDTPAGLGPSHRPLSAIAAAASGGVPQARIRRVLADVAGSLATLHQQGQVHGAVAMSTIGLDSSGQAHLLTGPLAPAADAENAVRIKGYASFEQYTDDPERPCGPWTDIYALAAVAHSLVVGAAPPDALARCVKDTYVPLAGRDLGAYDADFLQAIDRGLSMTHTARQPDLQAAALAFGFTLPAQAPAEPEPVPEAVEPDLPPVAAPPRSARGPRVPLLVMLGVLAAVALAVYLWLQPGAPGSNPVVRTTPAPAPAEPSQTPVPTPPALSDLGRLRAAPGAATAGAEQAVTPPTESDTRGDTPGATPAQDLSPQAPAASGGQAAPSAEAATGSTTPPAAVAQDGEGSPSAGLAPDANPALPAETTPGAAQVPGSVDPAGGADQPDPQLAAGAAPPEPDAAGSDTGAETPVAEAPPATVAVRVQVRPWGEVLVDGRSRGISPPLTQLMLAPGKYRVTIRNPAAPEFHTTVTVSSGGSASISHVFE